MYALPPQPEVAQLLLLFLEKKFFLNCRLLKGTSYLPVNDTDRRISRPTTY